MSSSCFSTKSIKKIKQILSLGGLSVSLLFSQAASATIVQFQTVLGDFQVNLFDKTTPKTVANFLTYVNANAYTNTFIHRSVPGFVVQGGGYTYQGELPLIAIPRNAVVENEPVHSNLRGTIAMAKGSAVNSATNQWFINLNDKNATDKDHGYVLDRNTGGFTVFGQVMDDGMVVVDAIAALSRFNMSGVFSEVPLRNYTTQNATDNVPVTDDHLMLITNIIVLDASPDTAANLNPKPNTLIKDADKKKDDGGGSLSISLFALLGALILSTGLRRILKTTE